MNRRDFGIGGSSTISNDLTIEIKVLARAVKKYYF